MNERRSLNDIAWDIIQIAPEAEPLCEEFFETTATGNVLGSLARIRAAAESDADLANLPALRAFLLAETEVAAYALAPSTPTDEPERVWRCETCDVLAIPAPGYTCWDAGHPHVVVKPDATKLTDGE